MRSTGFSLLEVLVSIAILALIMTLVWQNSSQTFRVKSQVEKRAAIYHEGVVLLRRFSDDISMAFLARSSPTGAAAATATSAAPATATSAAAAGEAGTTTPVVKTFFIGKDNSERDGLSLTSLSHLRFFKDAKESDQCKVSYEVLSMEGETGLYAVVRREEPWLDSTSEIKAKPLTVVENITGFNVEYYDIRKGEWGKEWDTEKIDWKDRLPDAVRVTVSFPDPQGGQEEIRLSTAVMIPLAKGPIEM